jgi:hypothetical protein
MKLKQLPLTILLVLVLLTAKAQDDYVEKKIYNTKKISEQTPRIDGLIDDQAWNIVEWSGGFIQRSPNDGEAPSQKTEFKILYDDNNLYILIRAFDTEPEKIVERKSRRDGLDGDWVEVNIDSYFDKRTAFSFTASVSGVKSDQAISKDGDVWDSSWDPIWYLKTSIDKEGWIAEIKIPLTQLRFNNHKENPVWGLQVNRRLFRDEEKSHWSYFSKDESGWVRHFGELHGLKNIKPKMQVELSPYITAKQENFEKESGNPYKDKGVDRSFGIGLDGKIGITNDFTLDFAINPDFGQVEADPSEVNLTAFETQFSEKRPFFIEGKEITSYRVSQNGGLFTGDNLFYSRRIGCAPHYYPSLSSNEYENRPTQTTILGALKLTGKTKDGLTIGIIETLAAEEKSEIYNTDNNEERKITIEPMTNYLVARVQKDLNNNNTIIGGILTSTNRFIKNDHLNYLNTDAYTGGLDFKQYFKNKKYYLAVKYEMSQISGDSTAMIAQQKSSRRYFQRPNNDYTEFDSTRTSMTGYAGAIEIGRAGSSKWRWTSSLALRSPEFEINDIGYLQRADLMTQVLWIGYKWTKPFSIFRTVTLDFNEWSEWDFGLTNNYWVTSLSTDMVFKNHYEFFTRVRYTSGSASNSFMRGGPTMHTPPYINYNLNVNSDPRKKLHIIGRMSLKSGLENYKNFTSYAIYLVYRPNDAIKFSFNPTYSVTSNELQYLNTEVYNNEKRYVYAQIDQITTSFTLRIDYSITPDLTIQYYGAPYISAVDYSEPKYITDPNADKFVDRYSTDMSFSSIDYKNVCDFNFRQFRSNLVVRWEYRPGSLLYLVWTQGRTESVDQGNFSFVDDFDALFSIHPHNVFLVKLSFRLAN